MLRFVNFLILDPMITNGHEVVDGRIVVTLTVIRQVINSSSLDWKKIPYKSFSDANFPDPVGAQTISEICRKTAQVWDGGLILKNSLFPTR